MKEEDDSQKFSEAFGPFAAEHRQAVWAEVLKPRREALGDPNWKPKYWSEGVGYQSEVFRILRERFQVRMNRQGRELAPRPVGPIVLASLLLTGPN
jgi:hypothetical protein